MEAGRVSGRGSRRAGQRTAGEGDPVHVGGSDLLGELTEPDPPSKTVGTAT